MRRLVTESAASKITGLAVQTCVGIGKIAGSEAFLSIDLGPDLAGAFAALEDLTRYLDSRSPEVPAIEVENVVRT